MELQTKPGESIELAAHGRTLTVRRLRRSREWTAQVQGVADHSRFGSREQITEDIEHFNTTGSLPRGRRTW